MYSVEAWTSRLERGPCPCPVHEVMKDLTDVITRVSAAVKIQVLVWITFQAPDWPGCRNFIHT